MNSIKRRTLALVALVLVTSALSSACQAKNPNSPDPVPTPNPGGTPTWSTLVTGCSVNPTPVKPEWTWEAKVVIRTHQSGLSYKSQVFLKDQAGNEKQVGSTFAGVTQATGQDAGGSNGDFAPRQEGDYKVIFRYTESLGELSNTITSECGMVVRK